MISGAFFLDPNKNIQMKKLFQKYILRLIIAYIFWSFFYAVEVFILSNEVLSLTSLKMIIKETITSHYHLEFLPMIIGLYLLVPILRLIRVC
jgi:surface polysaccharide O-acyltransferase-like enzyme